MARECLAGSVLAADSVQVCPYGPTCGGRLLSGLCRTVVSKERISGFFGGNSEVRAAKVNRKAFSQRSGARGRRQASSRNSLPPLNAMPVVQAKQSAQRVLRKRACVFFGRLRRGKALFQKGFLLPPRSLFSLSPLYASAAGCLFSQRRMSFIFLRRTRWMDLQTRGVSLLMPHFLR